MSDHPESRNGLVNPSVHFEPTDLGIGPLLVFIAGLVVTIAILAGGLWLMIPAIIGPVPSQAPIPPWKFKAEKGSDRDDSYLPAKPELEAIGQESGDANTRPVREQIRQEDERLKSYGWVDKEKGIVYIPIEDAMQRLGGRP